jgi:hypothetical protein
VNAAAIPRIRRVRPCAAFVGGRGKWCLECLWRERFHVPRFQQTYCSQCGGAFGPGNYGYSHCEDHQKGGR